MRFKQANIQQVRLIKQLAKCKSQFSQFRVRLEWSTCGLDKGKLVKIELVETQSEHPANVAYLRCGDRYKNDIHRSIARQINVGGLLNFPRLQRV